MNEVSHETLVALTNEYFSAAYRSQHLMAQFKRLIDEGAAVSTKMALDLEASFVEDGRTASALMDARRAFIRRHLA